MIDQLLPAEVATAECFDDLTGPALFAEEAAAVAGAVGKRRREFTTGRILARRALSRWGVPPQPLLPGPRGEPRWPTGFVGAITHCAGYRAAAVAATDTTRSLGIDAEPHEALPAGVLEAIARPEEAAWLQRVAVTSPAVCWARLLFSAKESVYKAWYPLTGRPLEFDEALVTPDPLDPHGNTLQARLLVLGPRVDGDELTDFTVRWRVAHGFVLTAVVINRRRPVPAVVPGRR